MNLAAYLNGSVNALLGLGQKGEQWPVFFDLSRRGFKLSFLAVLFTVGCYYICGLGLQNERALRLSEGLAEPATPQSIPLAVFFLLAALYALTFVGCAYILAMVFDKQDRFRPWVIVRHWSVFFVALFVAFLFALYLYAGLPFGVVNMLALIAYLSLLAIDIRLAQKIAGFDWGGAILTGCVIHGMSLTVIVAGAAHIQQGL